MKTFIIFAATLLAATHCFGDIVHDEDIDGDLSNDNLSPTVLVLGAGSNEILASSTFDPLDRDFWTVTIDPGFELSAIILQLYDTIELQSFFAVEAGSQVTSLNDPSSLLGNAVIGFNVGAQQGDDVLDDLGNAVFGGTGFTGPLGPGTYTFWYQENNNDTNYEFDFIVSAQVPEPSSIAVCAILALGPGIRRRRTAAL